jgi:hypothetical protein|tara:strand:- start:620 stop:844 length:225 start_codon:yes stop_codon:yes gene_type:complete
MKEDLGDFVLTQYNRKALMSKIKYLKSIGGKVTSPEPHSKQCHIDGQLVFKSRGSFTGYKVQILNRYHLINKNS